MDATDHSGLLGVDLGENTDKACQLHLVTDFSVQDSILALHLEQKRNRTAIAVSSFTPT